MSGGDNVLDSSYMYACECIEPLSIAQTTEKLMHTVERVLVFVNALDKLTKLWSWTDFDEILSRQLWKKKKISHRH